MRITIKRERVILNINVYAIVESIMHHIPSAREVDDAIFFVGFDKVACEHGITI